MPVEVIEATNWEQIDRALTRGAWNERLQRFRADDVYRGVSEVSWSMQTSLARLGYPDADVRRMESVILNSFIKYAHHDYVGHDSLWNWLSLAQHHGLPTRLLDWTYSPYVALHFAVGHMPDPSTDGVVWRANVRQVHSNAPTQLGTCLQREGFSTYNVALLDEVVPTLNAFNTLQEEPFALFFEPPSLDHRIINQYALFSVMSDPTLPFDSWLEQEEKHIMKLIIPGELKWHVRDRLDWLNITERVLFPGLDGLCSWLRRYYTPHTGQGSAEVRSKPTSDNQNASDG
jgi:hypothetical protein